MHGLCRRAAALRKPTRREWRVETDLWHKSPRRPRYKVRWEDVLMTQLWFGIIRTVPLLAMTFCAVTEAQPVSGPYAVIGRLHPRDGHTVEFESGYIRHLAWHQQVRDTRTWYGWTVAFGERQRWFAYATFGRSAAELDNPVSPAEDWKDAFLNFEAHTDSWESGLYEFLPALSRGNGVPTPEAILEQTTVELRPGAARAFEEALAASRSRLQDETLWFRRVAGGAAPTYVRLRPSPDLSKLLDKREASQPWEGSESSIAGTTVEILALRPTMSLGPAATGRLSLKP
jgi:hypothetical protein